MISVRDFSEKNGEEKAQLFLLENGGASVYITDFGGHIVSLNVPDRNGILTDVVLGFDHLTPYTGSVGYMGATVGRHANRIEKGKFVLNGKEYSVAVNNGPNHLHGGLCGFNHRVFDAYVDGDTLTLSRLSPDGEEGYPGNLHFSVSFTLTDQKELVIEYRAQSDQDTVVNFTNHAYFNLNGALSQKSIENHELQLHADGFCRGDRDCLADGAILPVRNTGMDFRTPANLGERLNGNDPDIRMTGGIDHNFVLSMQRGRFRPAATLYSPDTGIKMECLTDQPGIQIYTGNGMEFEGGKGGVSYHNHGAICLETQNFPNATSFSYFPSPILRAGENFYSKTVYRFSVG